MRTLGLLFITTSLLACGEDPVDTASATDTGASTGATGGPPLTGGPDLTDTSGEPPTGSAGMTEGAATTGTTTTTGPTTTDPGDTTATTTAVADASSDTGTTVPADTGTTIPADTGDTGDTGASTTTGDPDTTDTGDDTTGDMVEACACPDLEVPLDDGIFVLSITAELWKYFPEFNNFQKLGNLSCPLPPSTFSMAVDRLGNAWVQYSGGQLRTIPVNDVAVCNDPGYVVGQQGITNFGMAFVSNSQSDACDRIYGNRAAGLPEGNMISDFFSIDPDSLMVAPISKSDYGTAELTGTGDGRAFFFAGANPAKLIEIDKATGAKLGTTNLPGVELGSAWAFAFFGGDFYFFTNSQGGPGSEVTHIDYDDSDKNGVQDITVVVPDAPISIVGAGVSTCAPTAPQ